MRPADPSTIISPLLLNPPNLADVPPPSPSGLQRTTTSRSTSTTASSTDSPAAAVQRPSADFDFDFHHDDDEHHHHNHLLPGSGSGSTTPETSRLLPAKPKRHTVRVQGQLMLVKSVSVGNNLGVPPSPSAAVHPAVGEEQRPVSSFVATGGASPGRYESAFGARRRQSCSSGQQDEEGMEETEEERRERKGRDRQMRGYGIGGRGNIRRPTEVAPFGGKKHGLVSAPTTPTSGVIPKKWNLREKLGLVPMEVKQK